ncbi:Mitochondrial-processing peptidase subunit beta [Brettanomyces bruxellensis]|uniref:mitochondrial processing peptidase n=1 Tax=Dekkera bruxellensis TaxID=5007 RepID=A0A871R9G7_DEKBR|nr:Mitochondrial-processing peptidase subunit beta [Brettanomyces bruxellensis]QOU19732.1 Mitochondrial-processing peptidase subunit beta [Brettanomyces bruxellensis]
MLRNIARNLIKPSIRPLCAYRGLASASSAIPKVNTTVLKNGLTVATEEVPNSLSATIGMWIDAGSRADVSDATSGTAHFLEHLAFKGTSNRSQLGLELEVENCGSHLNAYTSRENTVYYAKSMKGDVPRAVDILSDILTRSKLENVAVQRERSVIIRESEEVDKMYDEVIFDRLHEIVYKDQPLGRTILGPIKNIKSISQKDLRNYIKTNYKGDRMVLVGVGSVKHDQLVKLAEKDFGHVPISSEPLPLGTPRGKLPVFCAGEAKFDRKDLPNTYIAISFEGCSWSSKNYFRALVAQAIIGNWDRAAGGSITPLAQAVSNGVNGNKDEPLCNSYLSFSTSYSDSGLWGVYLVVDKATSCKPVVDEIIKEWKRLCTGHISDEEVETAKAQLKGSLLLSMDGTTPIAEDIGRQLVTTGKRLSPEETFKIVNAITKKDVVEWCQNSLRNKPVAMASLGTIDTVPSYNYVAEQMKN